MFSRIHYRQNKENEAVPLTPKGQGNEESQAQQDSKVKLKR